MGFFNNTFLAEQRTELKNKFYKFQYFVDDTWYDATVNAATIDGNAARFLIDIPALPAVAHTITSIRALKSDNSEIGSSAVSIDRNSVQNLVISFEIPFLEV